MSLPIASPVYTLGVLADRGPDALPGPATGAVWQGNVRDDFGVDWIVETESGWSSTPPVRATSEDKVAGDGSWTGPGAYSARVINLTGRAVAPDRISMLWAKERIKAATTVRSLTPLTVDEAHMSRQAQVRLSDVVDIADQGSYVFTFGLTLTAPDPRRYDVAATVGSTGLPSAQAGPGRAYPKTYPYSYFDSGTPTGIATAAGNASDATYLVATDADASDIAVGATGRLYEGSLLLEPTVFTVSSLASAFGFTNIRFSPAAARPTLVGDELRIFDPSLAARSGVVTVVQAGDFDGVPALIRFDGPLANPRAEHAETGCALEVSITLNFTDYLLLDLVNQSVLLGGTANRANLLTDDSAWFLLVAGENNLRFRGQPGGNPGPYVPAPTTRMTVTTYPAWV